MTDAERRRRVEEVCDAALERAAPERAAFVAAACGSDDVLRREVEALLGYAPAAERFLAEPIGALAAHVLDDSQSASPVGRQIGPYTILSRLGAGGMGEVYRARDATLNRDAALKMLPPAFAADADRLARFQREAHILASLNHPNIAHVYGLEQSDDVRALAMELVEGPTLADRLRAGAISVDEALTIARQIAEALDAAHAKGIIHCDLKPANISVTPDGVVKVLDFGLAKVFVGDGPGSDLSQSPTVTLKGIREGVIAGTPSYMSPEQAHGKPVDKRTDIWAFGCVLYEMLAGERAFSGETASETLANVTKCDPPLTALPPETPAALRNVVRRCLEKDPRQRLRDIGDVRLALEDALVVAEAATISRSPAPRRSRVRPVVLWAGLLTGSVIVGAAAWALLNGGSNPQPVPLKRFSIRLPVGEQLPGAQGTLVAISANGQTLIYRASRNGVIRLYRRAMDQLDASPIGDENAAEMPFFSPDGQWIAFQVGNLLKKTPVLGGPSQTLAELPTTARGGAWSDTDTIILGARGAGLLRVAAAGGTPEPIAVPDGGREFWYPQILPGGRAVLFTSSEPGPDSGELQILVLETGERRTLLPGSGGHVLPSGHLVFLRSGRLWAAVFDPVKLAIVGNPVPVVEGVRVEMGGAVQFAVADDGTLAYVPGVVLGLGRLFWVDRKGGEEAIDAPPRRYYYPRLSPAGDRIALDVRDQEGDIWIWHITRKTLTRLTVDPALDTYPAWTSDGRHVIFSSGRENIEALFRQAADGTGAAERLAADARPLDQPVLSPDGKRLVFRAISSDTGEDVVIMSSDGGRIEPLLNTKFTERNAEVSPDGRWIAYQSNESGVVEVYVRPFPRVDGGRWQISTGGGTRPVWNRNGRELLYLGSKGMLMSAPVEAASAFSFRSAAPVVDLSGILSPQGRSYDVSPDGQRFLIVKTESQQGGAQINIVLNWAEELKQHVPTP